MRIVIAFSPQAGRVDLSEVDVADGATLLDALVASGLLERHPAIDVAQCRLGVWGASRQATHALRDGDRVEVYRPLKVDPKEARRLRHRSQRGIGRRG